NIEYLPSEEAAPVERKQLAWAKRHLSNPARRQELPGAEVNEWTIVPLSERRSNEMPPFLGIDRQWKLPVAKMFWPNVIDWKKDQYRLAGALPHTLAGAEYLLATAIISYKRQPWDYKTGLQTTAGNIDDFVVEIAHTLGLHSDLFNQLQDLQ